MDPVFVGVLVTAVIGATGTWLAARTPKTGALQQDYISNLRDDLADLRDELDKMVARVDRLEAEREELRRFAQELQLKSDRRALHIDRLETHMSGYGVPPLPRPEGV